MRPMLVRVEQAEIWGAGAPLRLSALTGETGGNGLLRLISKRYLSLDLALASGGISGKRIDEANFASPVRVRITGDFANPRNPAHMQFCASLGQAGA